MDGKTEVEEGGVKESGGSVSRVDCLDAELDSAGIRFLSSLAGEFSAELRFTGCICDEGQEGETYP